MEVELRASLPEEEAGAGRAMGLPGAAPGTPRPGGTSLAPSGGDPFSRTRGAAMGSGLDKPGPAVGRVGEENKGARRVSRRQPADLTRGRGLARASLIPAPGLTLPTAEGAPASPFLKLLPKPVVSNRSGPAPSRPRAEPGPAAALEFPGSRRPRRSSRAGGTGKAAPCPSPSSAGTW